MDNNMLKKSLDRRAALSAKLEAIKAEIAGIDATVKASLDYADEAHIIGPYKVFYKEVTRTSADMAWIKEHAPATYAKALVTKTQTYYAVK